LGKGNTVRQEKERGKAGRKATKEGEATISERNVGGWGGYQNLACNLW